MNNSHTTQAKWEEKKRKNLIITNSMLDYWEQKKKKKVHNYMINWIEYQVRIQWQQNNNTVKVPEHSGGLIVPANQFSHTLCDLRIHGCFV